MDEFLDEKEINLSEYYSRYSNKEELISVLKTKIEGSFVKEDIFNEETGEILFETKQLITEAVIFDLVDLKIENILVWEVKPEDKVFANTIVNDTGDTKKKL